MQKGYKGDDFTLLVLAWNVDPSGSLSTGPTSNFEVFEVKAEQKKGL